MTDTSHVEMKRLKSQKILGDVGDPSFVLSLTTDDAEFLCVVSPADLRNLAAIASKYGQEKQS
jgi:hypothetical protein